MCLILHGQGHITIKMMYEQIWPMLKDGDLSFLECYDFILRSHSNQAMNRLYILSPQDAAGEVFDLLQPQRTAQCDWAVRQGPDTSPTVTVEFENAAKYRYEATRLKPHICLPSWLDPANFTDDLSTGAAAAFFSTNMTMTEVHFADSQKVEPFDPKRAAETTYWLRLAYVPKVSHATRAIDFGPVNGPPLFRVQACEILNPSLVLSKLSNQLRFMAEEAAVSLQKGAEAAAAQALDRCFYCPGTSTRVEDHRVTLVTTPEVMISSSMVEGACGTLGVSDVSGVAGGGMARKWFMGANYYPTNDALTTARSVLRYVQEWGRNVNDAKSKEAITAALAPEQHPNISHIVEALCQLGLIVETTRKGYYFLNSSPPDRLLLDAIAGHDELDALAITQNCRDLLYGSLPVPDHQGQLSRFVPKGARIHYDLAYCG